jgi:tubulin-like protein CetZ
VVKMHRKILFIGSGQGGGNVAEEANLAGFPALAINTSKSDLDPLKMKDKLVIGTDGGCAKDRRNGKKIFELEKDKISDFIRKGISKHSPTNIIVSFSLTGGTGSSIGPLICSLLKENKVPYTALVICGDENGESGMAYSNEIEAFTELNSLNAPIIAVDNSKAVESHNSRNRYEKINKTIITKLKTVLEEKAGNKNGNMDTAEKLKLLTSPGLIYISTIKYNSNTNLNKEIADSFCDAKNIFVETAIYPKAAGHLFFVRTKPKNINYDEIYAAPDKIKPMVFYEGFIESSNDEEAISILSGLPLPDKRLRMLASKIEETRNSLNLRNEETKKSANILSSISTLSFDDEENENLSSSPIDTNKKASNNFGSWL